MTMFPAPHHRQINDLGNRNSYEEYGGGCGYNYYDDCSFISLSGGGSNNLMADQGDHSRTEINSINDEELATANTGSTSKDIINHQENINKETDDDHRGWLQLSLGSSTGHHQEMSSPHRPSLELDLLPGGSGSTSSGGGGGGGGETLSLTLTAPPRRQQQQQLSFQVPITAATVAAGTTFFLQPHHQRGWAAVAIDSAPPIPMALTSHQQQYDGNYMPFRSTYPLSMTTNNSGDRPLDDFNGGAVPLRMDFRVVDPPPRPHSGVWFILQASQNQIKEPYLPQVPKSYLRIKDGRTTTVRLLIKYLVDKLKLDSEFEIEVTCKGQQLLPFLTLQHVRDNIWNRPRNDVVFPHSSTTIVDHQLMVLNYGRIA